LFDKPRNVRSVAPIGRFFLLSAERVKSFTTGTTVSGGKIVGFGILHIMSCSTRKFIVFDHHLWKFDSLPVEMLLIFRLRAD